MRYHTPTEPFSENPVRQTRVGQKQGTGSRVNAPQVLTLLGPQSRFGDKSLGI